MSAGIGISVFLQVFHYSLVCSLCTLSTNGRTVLDLSSKEGAQGGPMSYGYGNNTKREHAFILLS